jgi:cholera toxin transcriptional activator
VSSTSAGNKSGIARFGVFEFDADAREVRKQGRKLRLQEQPFAVLAVLVERPRSIVSRQELCARLWPADTFVDFDHSLNTAVNKLREALGDSASTPRIIETVARRGYRLLPEVKWQTTTESSAGTEPSPSSDLARAHRGVTRVLFALIQIMYLAFYIEALIHWQGIERVSWTATHGIVALCLVLITACIGIPVRLYLISATAFDYSHLGQKFHSIFPGLFALDELWALAPFLIVDRIGLGPALGATAALLYVPFAERTLIRMAYCRADYFKSAESRSGL